MKIEQLAALIDHTLLKPDATPEQAARICREALDNGFAAVCVNPRFVPLATAALKGSSVKVCTVIGFPLGATTTEIKTAEARQAIQAGASEIDMVLWVGGVKSRQDEDVRRDISQVAKVCHESGAILKVILETSCLSDEEIVRACQLCMEAKADFVKTSTGFSSGGATTAVVRLMAETVQSAGLGVKASGGIRNYDDAAAMIEAGATRLGASAGVKIIEEARGK
ncbi:deoxyribose-phosphate aldolase [bacterium]|nr:deoxyribose-phosphate aldolase [bacterium]MBU1636841.1 deoxyribose-phosphate aldolase [bacterium]MBU1919628.1 deoxyribose-phosphate aldolase [bacterium]RQV98997.1 MAG: deoxyribose-phosphate aldolase [bacterium]